MAKTFVKTKAIGGSVAVIIPNELVKEEQIKPNEVIEIEVKKRKAVGFGMFKGMRSFSKEDEFDDKR
ncbi:MAG: hypothetical protein HYW27_01740 [Candidatus Aenigmarchaeota archaeon]|nr:hypothetical protein [Candidatus Aenigmarchaeota archaeon]